MAGDWIKFEASTPDKPEVWLIAQASGIDPDAVVGKLLRVWIWFDQHTENANAPSVSKLTLDRLVGVSGFCDFIISVGWMHEKDGVLCLPNFDRHNGKTAKNRALTAKRVAKHTANAKLTLDALAREEKRRDKKKEVTNVTSKKERAPKFQRPTVSDVAAYCADRANGIDPQSFVDYYDSNGWRVGRSAMKDWRAAVRTWEKRNAENQQANQGRKSAGQNAADFHEDLKRIERQSADELGNSFIRETTGSLRLSVVPAVDDD